MPAEPHCVVQVAVPVPLRRVFDYRFDGPMLAPGSRVKVPFGGRTMIGVVVSNRPPSSARRLKRIDAPLDADNLFGDRLLDLLIWASRYYHHPLGEALQTALPVALRTGKALSDPTETRYLRAIEPGQGEGQSHDEGQGEGQGEGHGQGEAHGHDEGHREGYDEDHDQVPPRAAADLLARAPLQARVYQYLLDHRLDDGWVEGATFRQHFPEGHDALRRLQRKGLVEVAVRAAPASAFSPASSQVELNPEQRDALEAIAACAGRFASFLLHGITGSGKTEVYLEAAQRCIAGGAQVLMLVPEIALTPQLVATVSARLGDGVCVLHSALSGEKRYRAWWRARHGQAVAVLGTRSAVFTPMKSLGLIVVDEEHDISYKQQDGFRYHARDLAIKRASLENIPVVLGSATPSMETRHNARQGRHRLLVLASRTGAAKLPRIELIDLKQHRPREGVSTPLLQAIRRRLDKREQSIVFLNRRGFAPVALCQHCGWQAHCERCDARLTYHRDLERFQCHHCGRTRRAEMACGACGEALVLVGAGTQRLQSYLQEKFPGSSISRLDRDQITTQDQLERELEAIQRRQTDIIIGTQLIAKGHDFSGVTLVGVVNSDQGLYSIDFRAPEYLFQQLTQVSGRAGRARSPGEVLVQTAHPDNHTLQYMRQHDFEGFARHCLAERRAANYPPFSHIALWRAQSTQPTAALKFLRHSATVGARIRTQSGLDQVQIMDAVLSPMEKLAGRYRAQLMVRSNHRGQLHQLLREWIKAIETDPQARHARWSIDIDPMEMF